MTDSIYTLIYISSATPAFSSGDIDSIIEASHRNNPPVGITGILMLKGGLFIQLLEGEKNAVKELFARISKDPRHEKVKVLVETYEKNRSFKEWSMAYKDINDVDLNWVNTVLKLNQESGNYLSHIKELKSQLK